MEIHIFSTKRNFRFRILGKTPVSSEQILVTVKQVSHFLMIFKFYVLFLKVSRSSEYFQSSKMIWTFWKNGDFVQISPSILFQNLNLLYNFDEISYETSLFEYYFIHIFIDPPPLHLKCENHPLLSDFDNILYEKSSF